MSKLVQTSPSPNSLPAAAVPPSFDSISPPAPISIVPNESNSVVSDVTTDPDQLIDPPLPSILPPPLAPTLQSSPPPQPANSPPAATDSPPPAIPDGPPPASPPPPVNESPPPSQTPPPPKNPSSPPPLPPSSSPPPTDATLSPPPPSGATLSPPPPSPPPADVTSPPPAVSPPPSPTVVPPPQSSPSPPQAISSFSPPPAEKPAPPSPAEKPSPPTPAEKPASPPPADKQASPPPAERPASPPPADKATSPPPSQGPPSIFAPSAPSPPPPNSQSAPPPTVTITPSPPGPSPPLSLPTSPPPPTPTTNTSEVVPPTSQIPTIPTEKPIAKPTNDNGGPVSASSKATGGLSSGGAVAVSIVVAFVVLGLIATAVLFMRKRKNKGSKMTLAYPAASQFGSPHNSDSYLLRPPASLKVTKSSSNYIHPPSEQGGMNSSRSWFTYEELAHATDWFSADNELGEGGFGKVYKGVLEDGTVVAVKQLKTGGGQGEREFRAEVEIISRIHHRHLVSLVGYCISEQQRLLVYDYVPNNTLHYHLHGIGRPVMEWCIRVKVAAGAARGLAYLHEDCNPRIIHRDIKSSNILIDNNYEAKVADFGLAKLAMELDSQTHVSTRVMGTFGYMAPEYATTGKLTEKSDVYSFGVVLLELITAHKPIDDSGPLGDESLVEWARPRLAQALESEVFDLLVDPRLERNYSAIEMYRMIEAAAACVRHQAARRPKMSQVVRALDTIGEEADLSNGMKFGQSEAYDSAEHSAQIKMFRRMAFGNGSSQDYSSSYMNDSRSSWRN